MGPGVWAGVRASASFARLGAKRYWHPTILAGGEGRGTPLGAQRGAPSCACSCDLACAGQLIFRVAVCSPLQPGPRPAASQVRSQVQSHPTAPARAHTACTRTGQTVSLTPRQGAASLHTPQRAAAMRGGCEVARRHCQRTSCVSPAMLYDGSQLIFPKHSSVVKGGGAHKRRAASGW